MSSINLDLNLRQLLNETQINYYRALKSIMHTVWKLIRIYRSVYLDNPIPEFGLRYQHNRSQPVYHNSVRTIHELDSDNHDTEASNDLGSMYTSRTRIMTYCFPLTLKFDRMWLPLLVHTLPLCNSRAG